jgi:hypothetical protein
MAVMRRALVISFILAAVALAGDATEIQVYKRGKVLSVDKDQGETLYEAFVETWSFETGTLEKTEKLEVYCHLSEDGEVLTPRSINDKCREKFVIEKKGTKWFFGGARKEPPKEPPKPEKKAETAAVSSDALAELKAKAVTAAVEIAKIDAREARSAEKRRKIIEDRGLQVAFNDSKEDGSGATAVADAIEGKTDMSAQDRYYVLRSFGWQRHHEHDLRGATIFYERCVRLLPDMSSGHYDFALLKKEQKDTEGEVVELVRALRGKPTVKYVQNLQDALKRAKPTKKLDGALIEKLTSAAQDARDRLEQSPPDTAGARKVGDDMAKLVDDRFPPPRKDGE